MKCEKRNEDCAKKVFISITSYAVTVLTIINVSYKEPSGWRCGKKSQRPYSHALVFSLNYNIGRHAHNEWKKKKKKEVKKRNMKYASCCCCRLYRL